MSKVKVVIPRIPDCDDSFFYDGLIATKGELELIACGMIRIDNAKGEFVHDGWKARGEGITLNNDKDLEQIDGVAYTWENNNWFEIIGLGNNFDLGEVYFSYDKAISAFEVARE